MNWYLKSWFYCRLKYFWPFLDPSRSVSRPHLNVYRPLLPSDYWTVSAWSRRKFFSIQWWLPNSYIVPSRSCKSTHASFLLILLTVIVLYCQFKSGIHLECWLCGTSNQPVSEVLCFEIAVQLIFWSGSTFHREPGWKAGLTWLDLANDPPSWDSLVGELKSGWWFTVVQLMLVPSLACSPPVTFLGFFLSSTLSNDLKFRKFGSVERELDDANFYLEVKISALLTSTARNLGLKVFHSQNGPWGRWYSKKEARAKPRLLVWKGFFWWRLVSCLLVTNDSDTLGGVALALRADETRQDLQRPFVFGAILVLKVRAS